MGDLIAIIKRVTTTLEITLPDQDIRDIYRRPGQPEIVKVIMTEFNFVKLKEDFFTSVRRFNRDRQVSDKLNYEHVGIVGNKGPIFVDADLPYSTRKLFFRACEFAKTHDYKFRWTAKGKVLLRKG